MDISKLTHDAASTGKGFIRDDIRWITTQPIAITFPKRYLTGGMGNMTNTYNPIGCFAIIVGNTYAVMLVPMNVPLRPERASVYTQNGEDYMLLEWDKGGIICDNLRLVQNNNNVYQIFNEFIGRGKTPWYFSTQLRAEIFRNNQAMAGVSLGGGIPLESLMVANITRDKNDRRKMARYSYTSQADYDKSEVVTIALLDIGYGAQSGVARTIGGYAEDGYVAELIDPTESVDKIDQLMRT